MVEKWLSTAIAAFVFIMAAKYCSAIKCWDCRSDADIRCADPFDNSTFHFTDCNSQSLPHLNFKPTMCRKIRQKVNGEWRYIRSCAWLSDPLKTMRKGDERYCLIRSGTWDIHIEYCECYSKDGCNSATKSIFSWSLAALTLFAASLPFKLLW